MNKLFIGIFVFFLLLIISCNNQEEEKDTNQVPEQIKKDLGPSMPGRLGPSMPGRLGPSSESRAVNPGDCKAHFVSSSQTECFYSLPNLKDGETFTGNYQEALSIHTRGVTVGQGLWICKKGQWYETYRVCLTCLPGHSLEHCKNSLENLIKKGV